MSDLGTAKFRAIDTNFTAEDKRLLSRSVFFGGSGYPSHPTIGIPITSSPEGHSIICGKTRAGKGVNVLAPTLLRADRVSMFVLDPKAELASISARSRAMHSYVHIINPWHEQGDTFERMGFPAATYNPLDLLKVDDPNCVANAKSLAKAMSPNDGDREKFWANSAADLITAVLLWLTDQPGEEKTLRRLAYILSRGRKMFVKEYVTQMAASEAFGGAICQLASPYLEMPEQTFGGIWGHIAEAISFLADPQIVKATASSSFSMADLPGAGKSNPTTVYLVVPWDLVATQKVWLRLMIEAGMQAFRRKPRTSKYRGLFIFEELRALGYIETLATQAATVAGSGVDMAFVVQAFNDIEDIYGKAAESIIANCAYKWFCNIDHLKTAEFISRSLGKMTVQLQHSSESTGENKNISVGGWSEGSNQGESTSRSLAARDLLTPDEVMGLGSGTAILLAPGGERHVLHPVPYWELKETFAAYPGAFPVVYYDRNLALSPEVRQCAPVPPPVPAQYRDQPSTPQGAPAAETRSGSTNYDPKVYAPKEMKAEPARPPIDWTVYAPKETKQPKQPAVPAAKQAQPPEETRSGSPNYDPAEYAPPEIREQMREELRKIKKQDKKKPQT